MAGLRSILANKRKSKWAMRVLYGFIIISILHPFIANDVPLISKDQTGINLPVFKKLFGNNNLNSKTTIWEIRPFIPYSANSVDLKNSNYKSPFSKQNVQTLKERHWLGTDKLGRDTFAGLLYGSWTALIVGLFAALFSVLIGVVLGLSAGYFGDEKIRYNLIQVFLSFLAILLIAYTCIVGLFFGSAYDIILESLATIFISTIFYLSIKWVASLNIKEYQLPLDQIVLRVLELFKAVPGLFMVLALLAIIRYPSVFNIIWIIAFVSWPISCRYTRAEVLAAKEEDYIKSASSLGIPTVSIILRHLLPNVIGPAVISFAFGVSSAIVLEATLSFLGLGLSVEQVTWGSMLAEVRTYYKAWWLVLFPGILLFLIVAAFNSIGTQINESLKHNEF